MHKLDIWKVSGQNNAKIGYFTIFCQKLDILQFCGQKKWKLDILQFSGKNNKKIVVLQFSGKNNAEN